MIICWVYPPNTVTVANEGLVRDLWGRSKFVCMITCWIPVAYCQEFFDFACPASSLGIFLEMCNEETLLHPFCDLRFSRFLQEYHQGGKVMHLKQHALWGMM